MSVAVVGIAAVSHHSASSHAPPKKHDAQSNTAAHPRQVGSAACDHGLGQRSAEGQGRLALGAPCIIRTALRLVARGRPAAAWEQRAGVTVLGAALRLGEGAARMPAVAAGRLSGGGGVAG